MPREWGLAGRRTVGTAPIARGNVMPPYKGKAVTWKLVRYA